MAHLEAGGRILGPRPMETLLIGMGGCLLRCRAHHAKPGGTFLTASPRSLQSARLRIEVFTKIHVHFILTGHGLKAEQVKRAVTLSAEKYCSASVMLGKTAQMTHDFEIREG
jgi:putative redox protein